MNIASQLWSGGQKGEGDRVDQKQHGGGWLKMKGKQLCGSHGRIEVGRRRMSKPQVPYVMERDRIGYEILFNLLK